MAEHARGPQGAQARSRVRRKNQADAHHRRGGASRPDRGSRGARSSRRSRRRACWHSPSRTSPLPSSGPPNIESVAVLPFVNATGDPELEYLSDGVTESLINALGQLPDLSVKARSMVFRYKGKEADPQEVASALSVDAVVNGRLERRGDRLMLSLALANGERRRSPLGRALRQHDDGPRRGAKRNGARHRGKPAYATVRRGRATDSAVVHRERRGLPALPQGPLSRPESRPAGNPDRESSTWNRRPRSTPITPSPTLALRMPTAPHPQPT